MNHSLIDLTRLAGVPDEHMEHMLWEGTAYPFARGRTLWYQLRHSMRHQKCVGDPMAMCCSRKAFK